MIGAALESQEAGQPKAALKFLEPLFADGFRHTDEEHDYALAGDAEESQFLQPPKPAVATEAAWMHFLESHPAAFDSLDILDDLAGAVLNHEQWDIPGVDQKLMEPLLQRSKSIIDKTLGNTDNVRIVWMFTENRPALRCLVQLMFLQQRYGNHDAEEKLAEKILSLNPDDNHGLRTMIINAHLRRGDNDSALSLAEQYPEDLNPDISYGRALALYRLERYKEAEDALADAITDLPKIPRFLSAKRIRKPKLDPYGVVLGGDDQAWLYREEMRDVWSSTPGALAWLKR